MADVLTTPNNDLVNELLIAKLLEDDMRELESLRTAEELQLNETLADRKSTRLNSSHSGESRMPSSA